MKNIFLILLLIAPLTLSAIDPPKELKRGIYKTYDEFLQNNPSFTGDFIIDEYNNGRYRYDFTDNKYGRDTLLHGIFGMKVKNAVGFCDGKNVYLVYSYWDCEYIKIDLAHPHPLQYYAKPYNSHYSHSYYHSSHSSHCVHYH